MVEGPRRELEPALDGRVEFAVQERPLGTADAVKAAAAQIDPDRTVIVLYGDVPLITAETLRALADAHARSGRRRDDHDASCSTTRRATAASCARPTATVERVVETKAAGDASELELHIREINAGIYAFDGGALLRRARRGRHRQRAGRVLPARRAARCCARTSGRVDAYVPTDQAVTLGVNDRVALAHATPLAQRRRSTSRHMLAGVTILNPAATVIDVDVEIGADTVIEPFTSLRGATAVGEQSVDRPAQHADRRARRRRALTVHPLLRQRRRDRRPRQRRPVLLPAPRHDPSRGVQGGHVRRDQEFGRRRRAPRSPTSPTSATPTSARRRTSAPATITANYDGSRKHRTTIGARVQDERRHDVRRAGHRRRRRIHRRRVR